MCACVRVGGGVNLPAPPVANRVCVCLCVSLCVCEVNNTAANSTLLLFIPAAKAVRW